jgi:hypothetical protein
LPLRFAPDTRSPCSVGGSFPATQRCVPRSRSSRNLKLSLSPPDGIVRIGCSSYRTRVADERSFKTDVNFSNTLKESRSSLIRGWSGEVSGIGNVQRRFLPVGGHEHCVLFRSWRLRRKCHRTFVRQLAFFQQEARRVTLSLFRQELKPLFIQIRTYALQAPGCLASLNARGVKPVRPRKTRKKWLRLANPT